VNWTQLSIALGIVGALGGALWKLAAAWTKKAIAIGANEEAERAKVKEVAELRQSFANFMARMSDAEKVSVLLRRDLDVLVTKVDERERARRDTQGIPVRSDGE
jgi:hypothetical protein